MNRFFAAAIGTMAVTITLVAIAAPPKKPARAPKKTPMATSGDAGAAPTELKPASPAPRERGTDAGVRSAFDGGTALESKTLDGGAKVYRFGEMEIETRLKSPEIVYFLRRVRAEFGAQDLGHRSFMPELSQTRSADAVR